MEIIKLPCEHCFIPEAIVKWVKEEKAICPVCRYALDSKEVEDKSTVSPRRTGDFIQSIRRASRTSRSINQPLNWALPPINVPNSSFIPEETETEAMEIDTAAGDTAAGDTAAGDTAAGDTAAAADESINISRITTNFINDIMNELINDQEEANLQQALLNSLNQN